MFVLWQQRECGDDVRLGWCDRSPCYSALQVCPKRRFLVVSTPAHLERCAQPHVACWGSWQTAYLLLCHHRGVCSLNCAHVREGDSRRTAGYTWLLHPPGTATGCQAPWTYGRIQSNAWAAAGWLGSDADPARHQTAATATDAHCREWPPLANPGRKRPAGELQTLPIHTLRPYRYPRG